MRKLLFLLFVFSIGSAQQQEIVSWIDAHAVVIEDANPDSELTLFGHNVPDGFKNARIFGFGEASHHGKEFFNLKAKFFKYLVEHQGVTAFIMEESYQAERGVNAFITGGAGDAQSVLENFGQGIWRCKEVSALLQWMRDCNTGKPAERQIRFYGMENQFGQDIAARLEQYLKVNQIEVDAKLLATVAECSATPLGTKVPKGWSKDKLLAIGQVSAIIRENAEKSNAVADSKYKDMQRGLRYLSQFIAYLETPYGGVRDRNMYENVVDILEKETSGKKAFIWAHNEHIINDDYSRGAKSTGSYLKDKYRDAYYSVGFDFGKGELKGYIFENGKVIAATYRTMEAPYPDTFAATMVNAKPDIYFLDMAGAKNAPGNFFGKKSRQLFLGGPGFDPEKLWFLSRRYTKAYDGLIFVDTISPMTYWPKP